MNRLSFIWKNVRRKPIRFTLTCLSTLIAFYLFTILSGIDTALTSSVSASNPLRLMTSHKISLTNSLPVKYLNQINTVEQVDMITYASWFGGFYQNEKNQLAQIAVDSNQYFDIYSEYIIEKDRLSAWKNNRTGLIIGPSVANKYGWNVGDKVPIQSSIWMNNDNSFVWEFEISGIYKTNKVSTDSNQIFFHHKYFDEYRGYMRYATAWFSTKLKAGADINTVASNIDKLFANSPAETRTISEQIFMKERAQQLLDMSKLLKLVLTSVFFTLLLITTNTILLSIRERMNEIAMMKALGFSSGNLVLNTFLESIVIFTIGGVTGTILAMLSLTFMGKQLVEFLPGVEIPGEHYLVVITSIVILGLICSVIPAIQIKQLKISKTLGAKL